MATIIAQAVLDPQPPPWAIIAHHMLLQGFGGGLGTPLTAVAGSGVISRTATPSNSVNTINAEQVWDFTTVFYNRVAVIPSFLDVGSVSSAQQFQVEVWNGFFENRILGSITEIDAEGILISGGLPIGATFFQLQSAIYNVTIEADGPPVINAFIQWNLNGDSGILNIIGNRLSIFAFEPDTQLTEQLQWLTDVIRTYSGEQRIRLRKNARQVFEFVTQADNSIQTRMNSIMYGWQDKIFAVPEWVDGVNHTNPITSGDLVIFIDTQYRDFRDGGLAIIWTSDIQNEAVEIGTVESDRINLLREVVNDYPDGALVMPLVRCFAQGGLRRQIGRMDDTRSTITFRGADNLSMDDQTLDWPVYDGYEVLADFNAQFGSLDSSIVYPLKFIDNQTGFFRPYAERDFPNEITPQSWVVRGAENRFKLKKFLYRRLGRLKPFWHDSNRPDYILLDTIGASSIAMTVRYSNQKFLDLVNNTFGVHFALKDGTDIYRTIVGLQVEDLATEEEIIQFSANLGQEVTPEQVDRISLIELVRFNLDQLSLQHFIGEGVITRLTVPTITIKNPEVA